MVKDDILHESESGESTTYLIVEDPDSAFVPKTQDILSIPNSSLFNGNQEINLEETILEHVKSTQDDINFAASDNILNEIKSFQKFQVDVESKPELLNDPIISGEVCFKKSSNGNISGFRVNILKDRISSLGSELKSEDVIIVYLTK